MINQPVDLIPESSKTWPPMGKSAAATASGFLQLMPCLSSGPDGPAANAAVSYLLDAGSVQSDLTEQQNDWPEQGGCCKDGCSCSRCPCT